MNHGCGVRHWISLEFRGTGRLAGGINRSLQPDDALHWEIMFGVEAEKELGLDREMS